MTADVKTQGATVEGVASVDADHVVNRKRVLKRYCQAWLMSVPVPVPVPNALNRAFWSAVEKSLVVIKPSVERMPIGPFMLPKAFPIASIKNNDERNEVACQLTRTVRLKR